MFAWVLIGISLTFLLLLLDWLFPTGIFFRLGLKTRDYGATTCVTVLQSCIRTRIFFIYNFFIETQFFLLEPLRYGINVCPYVHFCSVCIISERVASSYL